MGTLERRETLTHRLGPGGRLSIKTVTGGLRVRGIEGEDVHVTVTYRIRAADQASAERALDSGRVAVQRGPGYLDIETPERRLSTGLAWLFGGARVGADISVDVPWGAKLRLETLSASIEAATLVGDQKYRTVSGDIRLWNLGGVVEAGTISGSIALDGGTDLRLRASTISGGIKARAAVFHSFSLSTTSGSMTVIGALDATGDYRAESISGGVDLTPLSGVTVELKTVSGSIHSEVDQRIEGARGFGRATVGDGRARVRVNSTSGSVRLRAPRPADTPAGPATAGPVSTGSAPSVAVAEAVASTDPSASAPVPGPEIDAVEEQAETWNPNETAEEAAESTRHQQAEDEELAVLQALERGEIGVDEAAARLERTGVGDDVR
jgi:hypothetical protein